MLYSMLYLGIWKVAGCILKRPMLSVLDGASGMTCIEWSFWNLRHFVLPAESNDCLGELC